MCFYITEVHCKLSNDTESRLDLQNYFFSKTFIRKDRNNSGGGLLIYFKDDIFVERVTDLENDTDENRDH
jgi:hypothetical protein